MGACMGWDLPKVLAAACFAIAVMAGRVEALNRFAPSAVEQQLPP
jgi:hypothetical protein